MPNMTILQKTELQVLDTEFCAKFQAKANPENCIYLKLIVKRRKNSQKKADPNSVNCSLQKCNTMLSSHCFLFYDFKKIYSLSRHMTFRCLLYLQ